MKKLLLILAILISTSSLVNAQAKKIVSANPTKKKLSESAKVMTDAEKIKLLNSKQKKVVVSTAKEEKMITTY